MDWQGWVKNASIGVLTMAAVQFTNHELRRRARQSEPSRGQRLAELGLAGVLAAGYSRLVPDEAWGVQSGFQFARLPAVMSLAGIVPYRKAEGVDSARWAFLRATEIAAWGAATGFLMNVFGEKPSFQLTALERRQLPFERQA